MRNSPLNKVMRWWCAALLMHVGALAVAADQTIWILLRDKIDAKGQRIAWLDLGAGHADAELDLPVSQRYIERLRAMGVAVRFLFALVQRGQCAGLARGAAPSGGRGLCRCNAPRAALAAAQSTTAGAACQSQVVAKPLWTRLGAVGPNRRSPPTRPRSDGCWGARGRARQRLPPRRTRGLCRHSRGGPARLRQ